MPKGAKQENGATITDEKREIEELYETVANGLTILCAESETGGDDISKNPARAHMLALSALLLRNGVLQALNWYASCVDKPRN
jgi:hypothetical protein